MAQAITGQPAKIVRLIERREALEGADADMAVAEADEHRRAGRRGLVIALKRLAGLDQREGPRRLDPERLQHLGREQLAHPALQRQPPVAEAAVGRLPRSLGAEVHQPPGSVAQLREQEAAAVADIGIVHPELVAVIAQRQRLRQVAGQRREAAEMARSNPRRSDRPARPRPPRDRCGNAGWSAESRPPRPGRRNRRPVRGSRARDGSGRRP